MSFSDFALTLCVQVPYTSPRSIRMETSNPIFSTCGPTVLLVIACLTSSLAAGEFAGDASLAEREQARRNTAVEEAQEVLRKGDEAYQDGRYSEASEAYAGALDMLPAAPLTAELRAATATRYAQAAVAQAHLLARKGDVAGAKAAVDKVLRDGVAPTDLAALACRAELDDPLRTNPALNTTHAQDVDAVRRLLYTAEGAYNLGKFAAAKEQYEKVLRLDPTNSAARRGLEQVAAARSDYQKTAYDHTRAEMLSQVDGSWELKVAAPKLDAGPADPNAATTLGAVTIAAKLEHIIIPKISLDQASLSEALDFLRLRVTENDNLETDPARKGVNFTVNLGPPESATAQRISNLRFNLQLTQVPLVQVLKYLCSATQTSYTTDDFAVIITSTGSSSNELISRNYRVPPDFITSLSSGVGTTEAAADPFVKDKASTGLLTTRLSAQDAFTKLGVTFPQGASANYSPGTNTLYVVNTATNLDAIAQIVATMTATEPVMVAVRVTMIKTQQTNLKELGFDWLVSPVALNGANSVFAAGGTVGNSLGRTGADFISPVNYTSIYGVPSSPAAKVASGVMTNGLRSGDHAIVSNSLDSLINSQNQGTQQQNVAPGVMAVTGLFSNNQVQMIMRGLDQKKGVDIMAQPSTVTRSGQASKISIVREFIYPTEYEPPQVPQSIGTGGPSPVTPATPTAFTKKDVGITLDVLPVADANKRFVDITLNPSMIDFDGFVNYGSPINTITSGTFGSQSVEVTANRILMPVFSVQKAATQLTVADGATIVMGGLMQESVQNVADQVPVFGSIPVLGRLFQSTSKQSVTTAIIFLVHVELLDPTGHPYNDR